MFPETLFCRISRQKFHWQRDGDLYVRNIEKKNIYWWPKNLSLTRTTSCILGDTRTIWRRRDHEITRVRLNETRFGPKKSRPRYISAHKISTLFWCNEWAWNWQTIFRFVSIHGRACFNRWKEHSYIVLQYTPKSTQK